MSEDLLVNPFRESFSSRQSPEPCVIVIFGATGDLTHRKLIPAIYNLSVDGDLPSPVKVVGFARRDKTDDEFRKDLEKLNRKVSRQGHDDTLWPTFSQSVTYHRGEFQDLEDYKSLARRLDEIADENQALSNRLFYVASAPEYFDEILVGLKESALNVPRKDHWSRVVVEKPFGTDLPSAEHLNRMVGETFAEKDTFRIDHYLGKETAQNLMVLRFANTIFEPLWNHQHVDSVQITCSEHLGMEGGRGGYYDKAGALRDMVQNHLLQLLSLVAMEPPTDLSADGVRDEKVKVIRSLRPLKDAKAVAENVIRAQYTAGSIDGKEVLAYREEDRVDANSQTETYVSLRVHIDNWRWSGVPFYIRMGKRLPKKATEISIHFKKPPCVLFNRQAGSDNQNVLVIRIQPDEGHSLRITSKVPGSALRMEHVKMDFRYSTSFGKASPEAYERLLLDAMSGDATLFARRDEVEEAWRFIDAVEHAWHQSATPLPMAEYPAGHWGPDEADEMMRTDKRLWRRL